MRAQLIKQVNDIRASYWFVPFSMVLGALCLTQLMTSTLVQSYDRWLYDNTWVSATDLDGARALLSIVSASILGVAGVTFSITIVAVSFASSNFGPRLINNFMSDRGSQYTLGTFLGTFVYCLVILYNVHGASNDVSNELVEQEIPQLATLLALPLALASIGVLIYFIHHIAETINIDNIVANIGHRLIQRATESFPGERCPDTSPPNDDTNKPPDFDKAITEKTMSTITASNNGYVQAVNLEGLQEIANQHDYQIQIHYGPGDFVSTFDQLMNIWSPLTGQAVHEEALRGCFAVGSERTEHQNTLFLVEQLAEVIARALSPGINDPYTAISCLNQFKSTLSACLHRTETDDGSRHGSRHGDNGRLRMPVLQFDRLVEAMFGPCRQYIAADTNVSLHAITVLASCAWQAGHGYAQIVIRAQMHALEASTAQQQKSSVDSQRISERYRLALQHLDDPIGHPLTGTASYWDALESSSSSTDKTEFRPVRK